MAKRPRIRAQSGLRSGRSWVLLILLCMGTALIVLTRLEHPLVQGVRSALTDMTAPLMQAVAAPVAWTRSAERWLANWSDTHDRNLKLENALKEVPPLRAEVARLQAENRRLTELLGLVDAPEEVRSVARVIGLSGGAFVRNVIVQAGRRDGLSYGLPVTDTSGVVGRVIEVGRHTSRILLLTDLNSRVPVFVGPGRMPAIAAGRNRGLLSLDFLPELSLPQVGDQVVTSGHGGVFPPGLAVGRVVRVSRAGVAVLPAASLDRLDYVQVRRTLEEQTRAVAPPSPPPDEAID